MDVSDAVDALFGGVVPERVAEMRLQSTEADRFRLLDVPRFLLQASYGVIQVSEKALRLIWLTGFAAWAGFEAYSIRIIWERLNRADFDPVTWNSYPQQQSLNNNFDRLLVKIYEFKATISPNDFEWPDGVPVPIEGLRINDTSQKATFDLICIAGAFVFAHELRHALLDRDGDRPDRLIDEERECDRYALALLLDKVPAYAVDAGEDPMLVRAKRSLGIIFAQLAILTLTPRSSWDETDTHPAVRTRLRAALDTVADPVPEWLWTTIAAMLTAFAHGLGALPPPGPFPPTDRELAYKLCDALRSI